MFRWWRATCAGVAQPGWCRFRWTPIWGTWLAVGGAVLAAGAYERWTPEIGVPAAHPSAVGMALAGALIGVAGFMLGPVQAVRREQVRGGVAAVAAAGMIWLLGVAGWQVYDQTADPHSALLAAGQEVWAAFDGRVELRSAAAAVGTAAYRVAVEPHWRAVQARAAVGELAGRRWGVPRRLAGWAWVVLWTLPAGAALVYRRVWWWLWRVAPPMPAVAGDHVERQPDASIMWPRRPDPRAFDGLIGVAEAAEALEAQMQAWLRAREAAWFGVRPARGILLYGPPGTGKTSLARAAARYFGTHFLAVATVELTGQYVGETERRVRTLFARARQLAPCIIFLDEIDAVGRRRDGEHRNRPADLVLPALLQEMDGFHPLDGVLVLGATNRLDVLDDALVRRFTYRLHVGLPDTRARALLLERYLDGLPLAPDLDLAAAAARLEGFSPAELENACQVARQVLWMDYVRTGQARPLTRADLMRGVQSARGGAAAKQG